MKILFILFTYIWVLNANITLSSSTYKKLTHIQKLSESKQYTKALNIINELLKKELNKADKAYILQSQGFLFLSVENLKQAILSFKKMNNLNIMNKKNYLNTTYNIAQLHLSLKEYKQAIKYLNIWIKKTTEKKPKAHILLAQSYIAIKQNKKAIKSIKQAIKLQSILKRKIPINWYELLFSNYYQLKDYKNSIKTLYSIIYIEPKNKNYWLYLSQIYTIENQVQKGLSIFEQTYNLKILEEKDILQFISFLLQNELYYKGAELLSSHLKNKTIQTNEKNLKLLFDAYFNAREYISSLSILNKLINLTNKNKYILQKARLYVMLHQNKKAIMSYESIIKKKKSKEFPISNLELSYLYHENNIIEKCISCLNEATKHRETKKIALAFLKQLRIVAK
ncbi:tetratricopeptide repeat protein [Sulfurimonas sp.]|uniref:tetratricopeptide repeat protein n=1 Tax=Sulfurimonas sp. TaxID=2022749 RepID=UPI002B45FCA7|nr:CDC27 family protein [Sulfurimonas sp.]